MLILMCNSASAWLSGYDYRMQIDINNTGDNLTHYQYNITVDTAALTTAGKMDTDGKDCRITNSSDTLLNWWNETEFNSATTKIWIKAPELGNVTNTTHYIYYDKSGDSYVGNITNTGAKPSDDFNDGSIDTAIWNTTDSTATLTESGGTLRVQCAGLQWLRGEGSVVPTNVRIIQSHKAVTKLGYFFPHSDGDGDPVSDTNYMGGGPSYWTDKLYLIHDGSWDEVAESLALNTYYYTQFRKDGTSLKCDIYNSGYTRLDGLIATLTNAPTGRYYCFRSDSDDGYFNFIFTTNYTDTEPMSSLGSEESSGFSPISISSSSPGVSATKYVSNKTVTYSATPSKTADNKWCYGNGTFIEWDNSTVTPSTEIWINSSTINYFNISLSSYTTGNNSDNTAESWNNTINDDLFDSTNYTWSRWDELNLEGWIGYTGNIEVGDVDNDGLDEIIVVGSIAGSGVNNQDMIFYEIDGTRTRYSGVTSSNYQFTEASVHDVTQDGINELMCIYGKATTPADGIDDLYRFNTSGLNGSNLNNDIMTSGSNNPKAISWIPINGDEHFYSCGCGAGETVNIYTNLTSHSATEIDDFSISAEDNYAWDIDNDGQMELFVLEGWSSGAAKIWMYEINNATGAYSTKTLMFDNNSIGGTHFSAGFHVGDIDNDGIDNFIIHWLGPTAAYASSYRIEAYEFDNIPHYGEGNFSECIVIDTATHFCSRGHGKVFVGDVDNDGLNELLTGFHTVSTSQSYPSVVNSYDISNGGGTIVKNELLNCSVDYMGGTTYLIQSITPAFISQGRFIVAVQKEREDAVSLETEIYVLESVNNAVNDIKLGANKYGMLRRDVAAAQNLSIIADGFSHEICFTWWNSTIDKWESHYSGDGYNSNKIIPQNHSYFVLMDGTGETVECSVADAGTIVIPTGWSAVYLREYTNKTISSIKSDMGSNCEDVYVWNHGAADTGAWTNTGTFSVTANQGLLVNASSQFNWDGTVS